MTRLKEKFNNEISSELVKKFNYSSVMEVPKIEKIVINMGVGDAVQNAKVLDNAVEELTLITGQKPVITKAKNSIAGFRLREGMPIGAKVTLRGERMYEFFDKLISVSLPRVRDFRGISKKAFDGRLEFDVTLIPHSGIDSWVHDAILEAKKCLDAAKPPKPGTQCEFCAYRKNARDVQAVKA